MSQLGTRSSEVGRASTPPRQALPLAAFSAVLLLGSGPLAPDATLIQILWERFPRAEISDGEHVDGIVALGGHGERMIEAVRLARKHPSARLVISGRGEESWYLYALQAGIARHRIVMETSSRNTYENAVFSSRLAHPKDGERWILVTNAAHMPRAVGVFRKAGFNVLAWPLSLKYDWAGAARHEWLGLIAYRLFGRTDSLFPAPYPARDHIRDKPAVALIEGTSSAPGAPQTHAVDRKSL